MLLSQTPRNLWESDPSNKHINIKDHFPRAYISPYKLVFVFMEWPLAPAVTLLINSHNIFIAVFLNVFLIHWVSHPAPPPIPPPPVPTI